MKKQSVIRKGGWFGRLLCLLNIHKWRVYKFEKYCDRCRINIKIKEAKP